MSKSQHDAYLRDYRAVILGRKPAVIVERRKSRKAWLKVLSGAMERGLPHTTMMLADSTGRQDQAVIVGKTARGVAQVRDLIEDRACYTRAEFQRAMGRLLGYSPEDIESFLQSRLSLECGCELCGGPTPESRLDNDARKARTLARFEEL